MPTLTAAITSFTNNCFLLLGQDHGHVFWSLTGSLVLPCATAGRWLHFNSKLITVKYPHYFWLKFSPVFTGTRAEGSHLEPSLWCLCVCWSFRSLSYMWWKWALRITAWSYLSPANTQLPTAEQVEHMYAFARGKLSAVWCCSGLPFHPAHWSTLTLLECEKSTGTPMICFSSYFLDSFQNSLAPPERAIQRPPALCCFPASLISWNSLFCFILVKLNDMYQVCGTAGGASYSSQNELQQDKQTSDIVHSVGFRDQKGTRITPLWKKIKEHIGQNIKSKEGTAMNGGFPMPNLFFSISFQRWKWR